MDNLSVVIAEDDLKISEIQSRFIEKIEGFEVVGIANSIAESEEMIDVFQRLIRCMWIKLSTRRRILLRWM